MRILANSIPKAGTHLLKRCLQLLDGLTDAGSHLDLTMSVPVLRQKLAGLPERSFATAHLPGEAAYVQLAEELDLRTFLVVRDPRDLAVSSAKFIMKDTSHYLHEHYYRLPDDHARIMASVAGVNEPVAWYPVAQCDIGTLCGLFLPWRRVAQNLVVRFEDLIGPAGGGSRVAQVATVGAIARHVGLTLSEDRVAQVADQVFDTKSPTFRKGVIGDWRQHLSPEHVAAVKRVAGEVLVELGYEADRTW